MISTFEDEIIPKIDEQRNDQILQSILRAYQSVFKEAYHAVDSTSDTLSNTGGSILALVLAAMDDEVSTIREIYSEELAIADAKLEELHSALVLSRSYQEELSKQVDSQIKSIYRYQTASNNIVQNKFIKFNLHRSGKGGMTELVLKENDQLRKDLDKLNKTYEQYFQRGMFEAERNRKKMHRLTSALVRVLKERDYAYMCMKELELMCVDKDLTAREFSSCNVCNQLY